MKNIPPKQTSTGSKPKTPENLSVLLVEDNEDLAQYWSLQLGEVFQRVFLATHAYAALEVLHREQPDILISEVDLPEMDGYALCQEVRQNNKLKSIPVVLYKSGYLTLEDKRLAARSGAEDVITKPGSVSELAQIIRDVSAKSRVQMIVNSVSSSADSISGESVYADYLTRQLGDTIAQLKQQQETLNRYLSRFKDFSNCVGDFFWETDIHNQLTFLSASSENRLQLPTDQYEHKSFTEYFASFFSENALEEIGRLLKLGQPFTLSSEINSEYGGLRIVQVVANPYYGDAVGYSGFRGAIVDVTDAKLHSEKLYFAAHHDSLTGLLNAAAFESSLKNAMQSLQDEQSHVLCYLDLDFFKGINDAAGHRAGDEALIQVADLFRKRVRSNDILARVGGDEFAILLKHCGMDQARRLIQDIHNSIKTYRFFWETRSFELGLSIGLVEIHPGALTTVEVMEFADQACYAAKRSGRNQIRVFGDDATSGKLAGDALWLERFHTAINEDQLCLFSQPIKPAKAGHTRAGCEILVRMRNGDRLEMPQNFLSVVDRYQLTNILDRWVINSTIDWLDSQVDEGIPLDFYSVNISTSSICDPEFLDHIYSRLELSPNVARKICFEIIESAAMENLNNAVQFIDRMKKLGCRFALDDFGTGFSSLAHLKNLPVDYIKLDGLFIKSINTDVVDRGLVESIQRIAALMHIKTIAEYVESEEIAETLRNIGVDFMQGYHVGHPEMLPARGLLNHSYY
ncbi:MAG: two-component system response regulator [Thiotrichales bacterium]